MGKYPFKIVLLGEGRVGKTSLVLRFVNNVFSDSQQSTIQATYLQKEVKIGDNIAQMAIWDTAGQGALLVYDITDQDTFVRVQNWIKELRKVVGPNIKIAIAGNKCDLVKHRQVDDKQAEEYAKQVGATHFLTSAKANKGVEEAFSDLAKRVLDSKISRKSFNNAGSSSALKVNIDEGLRPSIHGGSQQGGVRVVQDTPAKNNPAAGGCC